MNPCCLVTALSKYRYMVTVLEDLVRVAEGLLAERARVGAPVALPVPQPVRRPLGRLHHLASDHNNGRR